MVLMYLCKVIFQATHLTDHTYASRQVWVAQLSLPLANDCDVIGSNTFKDSIIRVRRINWRRKKQNNKGDKAHYGCSMVGLSDNFLNRGQRSCIHWYSGEIFSVTT